MTDEQEGGLERAWRIWRYIWCVLRNLIVIAISLLAFGAAENRFQTLVLGILVLILISVTEHSALSYRNYLQQNAALSVDLANLGLALNRLECRAIQREQMSSDSDELTELEESKVAMRQLAAGESEVARVLGETRWFFWINVGGNYVVYLITIWNIINATFLS